MRGSVQLLRAANRMPASAAGSSPPQQLARLMQSDSPMADAPRTCADVMTTRVMTLSEEDNLEGIARAMSDFQIRHVPVVDGPKLVGLVSQRDLLRTAVSSLTRSGTLSALEKDLAQQTFVARVMRRDPVTVRAETPLSEAARLLVEHRIGLVCVVDAEANLVGVVSEIDVLRAAQAKL